MEVIALKGVSYGFKQRFKDDVFEIENEKDALIAIGAVKESKPKPKPKKRGRPRKVAKVEETEPAKEEPAAVQEDGLEE